MVERNLRLSFMADANRINARGGEEAMSKLERWAAAGVIELLIAEPAREEAMRGPVQFSKAFGYMYSMETFQNADEVAMTRKIEGIVFPGGARSESERNDVRILAHAKKHGCRLVTNDGGSKAQPGGILGHRRELKEIGVLVMRDSEAVALVERHIRLRDEKAVQFAKETDETIASWVGTD